MGRSGWRVEMTYQSSGWGELAARLIGIDAGVASIGPGSLGAVPPKGDNSCEFCNKRNLITRREFVCIL
jgi:hypothetical protein